MSLRFLLPALLGLCCTTAAAQPLAPAHSSAQPLGAVETLRLPTVVNDALAARDEARADATQPLRFAEPFGYTLDARTAGTWESLGDERVWRLVVESPGAYSLNFGFSRFRLPEGAALWIYAPGAAPEYRPFTAADNEDHGELWTPIVPGDRAVIELDLGARKDDDFELVLGQVAHAYRPAFLTAEEKAAAAPARLSGSCNVDVVCPEGDGYGDQIRSVGAYTRSGVDICSGAAVNTTRNDAEPNFLTANHCGNSAGNAASVVVYWNYQNSTCRTPGSPQSGGAGDGSRSVFNSGTVFRGSGAGSDWNLLTFDDPIVPEALVYLAGWDRRDLAPSSVVAIHHPGVEEKRISFENDPTSITSYLSDTPDPTAGYIRVEDWDLGTTEGGSSGSPIFSPEGRIVGQLHGGFASCTSQTPDWYGRVHRSMTLGLAALLDPTGSGAETVDGREANTALAASMAATPLQLGPGQTARVTVTVSNFAEEDANGIAFTNVVASGLTLAGNIEASAGEATAAGGTLSWTVDLAEGASATVSYDVTVDEGVPVGTLVNEGTVQHPLLDEPAAVSVAFRVIVPPDVIVENDAVVVLPDNGCPTFQESSIEVPAGIEGALALAVGVNATHTWRADLDIRVVSGAGTEVPLMANTGGSADNFDGLFSDDAPAGVFDSGNHDPAAPYYDVEGQPASPLAPLLGEALGGTWTLRICDDAGLDTGQLNRWALYVYTGGATDAEPTAEITAEVAIEALRPNPASEAASLRFAPSQTQHVRATVVDVTGRSLTTLLDGMVQGGTWATLAADLSELPAGTYFVRLVGETFVETRALTVAR